jgi:hypothetical protein
MGVPVEILARCPLSGAGERRTVHAGLRDVLFGAEGECELHECPTCGLGYLGPWPTPQEIAKAYERYCIRPLPDRPAEGRRAAALAADGVLKVAFRASIAEASR